MFRDRALAYLFNRVLFNRVPFNRVPFNRVCSIGFHSKGFPEIRLALEFGVCLLIEIG